MFSPQALLKGIVSRMLPAPQVDGPETERSIRLGRYGAQYVLVDVLKSHTLADEGSYFVANNAGAGVATAAAPTAFSDTAPLVTIFNNDSISNPGAKRIYLDYLRLITTAVGTAGTGIAIQIKIDNANRFASGGTDLAPVSPNMDVPQRASVATVKFLPVATAASVSARTVVGQATLAAGLTALLINHSVTGIFGMVESGEGGVLSATIYKTVTGLPPVIIGPGQCALINFLIPAQSAASSWTPEIAWWEK